MVATQRFQSTPDAARYNNFLAFALHYTRRTIPKLHCTQSALHLMQCALYRVQCTLHCSVCTVKLLSINLMSKMYVQKI